MAKRIDVSGLNVYYGKFKAVEDVSMTIEPRSVTAFIGPSGCGKSTVLRALAGLLRPDSGRVLADGHEVTATSRDRGMVFQDSALLPWRTVRSNIELALQLRG